MKNGPKKGTQFHGILTIGNTLEEAANRYRLAAMGKGVTAKVGPGNANAFVTTAATQGSPQLFNPMTGEMDLRESPKLLGQMTFEAKAGDADVSVTHYVCTAGCNAHVVCDSAKLLKFCPVCTVAVASEADDQAVIDQQDQDAADEADDEDDALDDELDDGEDDEDGDEDDEPGDDEEPGDDDEEDDEEDDEDDSAEASAGAAGEAPLVVCGTSKKHAIKVFRNARANSAVASADVEYLVCSNVATCGGHVLSEQAGLTACPSCQSALVEPTAQAGAASTGVNRVVAGDDEDDEDDDLSVVDDEDEDGEDDEEEEDDEAEASATPAVKPAKAVKAKLRKLQLVAATASSTVKISLSNDAAAPAADAPAAAAAPVIETPVASAVEPAAAAPATVEDPAAAQAASEAPTAENVDNSDPSLPPTAENIDNSDPSLPPVVEDLAQASGDGTAAPVVEPAAAPAAPAPVVAAPQEPVNTEEVKTDMLSRIDDSQPDAAKHLDVSFSAAITGQPQWTAYFQGVPVATARVADVGQNRDIFEEARFGHAVIASAKHVGVKKVLLEMGFKPVTCTVLVPSVINERVAEQVATATAALAVEKQQYAERLMSGLATAAIGINRGFFVNINNPIKTKLWNAMAAAGIKNPETLIDQVFRDSNDEYHRTLFAQASDIIAKPVEVQESLAQAILGTTYQGVAQASAGQGLEDRLANLGTVTASGSSAAAAPAAQGEDEEATASASQHISQVVSGLGRRRG